MESTGTRLQLSYKKRPPESWWVPESKRVRKRVKLRDDDPVDTDLSEYSALKELMDKLVVSESSEEAKATAGSPVNSVAIAAGQKIWN